MAELIVPERVLRAIEERKRIQKEKKAEQVRRWAEQNRDIRKRIWIAKYKRDMAAVTARYAKMAMLDAWGIHAHLLPPELVELKQAILLAKRELKGASK